MAKKKNTLRVRSRERYDIEVNDNGDIISFDLTDPTLALKYDKAMHKINRLMRELETESADIDSWEEEKDEDGLLTNKEKAMYELTERMFRKMRDAYDTFIGEGGCQKIFGDSNWLTMFDDLNGQLEPHFKKMQLNSDRFKKEVLEKYGSTDDGIL